VAVAVVVVVVVEEESPQDHPEVEAVEEEAEAAEHQQAHLHSPENWEATHQKSPQRQGGKQVLPTQLPLVPRNEPTCGTTGHPIPKKHDILVIYPRTPYKRSG